MKITVNAVGTPQYLWDHFAQDEGVLDAQQGAYGKVLWSAS